MPAKNGVTGKREMIRTAPLGNVVSMKRIVFSAATAIALAAMTVGIASAQAIPAGSYQQSCTNIHVRGDMLIARCNAPRGGTVRSSIALDSCRRGDIANTNGQLTCNNNNGNGYGHRRDGDRGYGNNGYGNNGNNSYGSNGYGNYGNGYAPGGSYQGSCINIQSRGGSLTASCTAPNGQRITSSINPSACRGADIANVNGYLRCR